jgi:hypothetical protein
MFVKGVSGNPHGRPRKGDTLTEILEELGKEKVTRGKARIERRTALAKKLWEKALRGDAICIKYLYDRIDGRPKESVEMQHSGSIDFYTSLTAEERKTRIEELRTKLASDG